MMEHPFVCNVWSHTTDPFSEALKTIFIENLINSMFWRNKVFLGDSPFVKKNKLVLI